MSRKKSKEMAKPTFKATARIEGIADNATKNTRPMKLVH